MQAADNPPPGSAPRSGDAAAEPAATPTHDAAPGAAARPAGLAALARGRLLQRLRGQADTAGPAARLHAAQDPHPQVPAAWCRFESHPAYERLLVSQAAARRMDVDNPFFRVHEGAAGATTRIDGREFVNFSSYDYLGLNGHPRIEQAVLQAVRRYGTSASASRLVAGERPVQRELERELADCYGAEECVAFVSGHATNVSTIGCLLGPKDLVLHDALVHNSVLEGIKLSGAHRRGFAHNDWRQLDALLHELRGNFERVLIVIEGLYSMDGDTPELQRFVEIKQRHKAWLMVDEAHSLGVLGSTGRGLAEHCGMPPGCVDIWMGTLSKSLAGCGGFIAGSRALVELLKYTAPGFVYSVGLSPALAAASLEALRMLREQPERVQALRDNGAFLCGYAKSRGIDTGRSLGFAVTPAITGSSLKAVQASNALLEQGFNVQPIVHPAVEERAARLRFFVCASHTREQIASAVDALARVS